LKKIISLQEIEKITDGNSETMKELLNVFIKEASSQIQTLQEHLFNANFDGVKNVAHKTKSSFTLIGLNEYRPLAEELEQDAGKDIKRTKKLVAELIIIYSRAISELKTKLR
jgi:HPt (histidine-containing phosphotransfer) domain-containing protein